MAKGRKSKFTQEEINKAKSNGVSREALLNRIYKGWSIEKAINTPLCAQGRKKYSDDVYETLKKNGISLNTFNQRLHKGLSLEEACKPLIRKRGKYKVRDRSKDYLWLIVTNDVYEFPIKIYDTAEELSENINISKEILIKKTQRSYKAVINGLRIRKVKKIEDKEEVWA